MSSISKTVQTKPNRIYLCFCQDGETKSRALFETILQEETNQQEKCERTQSYTRYIKWIKDNNKPY
jgi:hypothetical protein